MSTAPESYIIRDGMRVTERFFTVPLDHSNPDGKKIRVFARHIVPIIRARTPEEEERLPYLLFLQGGPGFEVPLPISSGYVGELHDKGYQTLWLDQRGTGLSTPLSPETLPENVASDAEIAQYLKHFRADNIVRDCELIREHLIGNRVKPEDRKWTLLGVSFGGFCIMTYLSYFPDSLKEVFIAAGLAPLVDQPDNVYKALIPRVIMRNQIFYRKYPWDVKRVRVIASHLDSNQVTLPSSGRLSVRRFQELGWFFGFQGGIDYVHQIILRAANDLELFQKLSYKLLQFFDHQMYDGNPLKAGNWSAARAVDNVDSFSWDWVKNQPDDVPLHLTGEMVFPSDFDDYANLRPWKGAAELLAQDAAWPPLYDLEQLAKNTVHVSSVTHFNDMYIDFDCAQETASKIKNTEQYITNRLVHGSLIRDSKEVMENLFSLSRREYD